jgi:hypothetical protein
MAKYLNDIAPVGRIVHKYDPKYPAGCPSCPKGIETQEHMLMCPCPKRCEWRNKLVTEITEILEEYQTPPIAQQLLIQGIQQSFGNNTPMNLNVPPTIATIANAQNSIGWDQLLKGRLANEWKMMQKASMQGKETKYKNA